MKNKNNGCVMNWAALRTIVFLRPATSRLFAGVPVRIWQKGCTAGSRIVRLPDAQSPKQAHITAVAPTPLLCAPITPYWASAVATAYDAVQRRPVQHWRSTKSLRRRLGGSELHCLVTIIFFCCCLAQVKYSFAVQLPEDLTLF